MEQCVRCKENGQDRRTLWMACMYEMSELPVPFEDVQIKGKTMKLDGTEHLSFLNKTRQKFADDPDAKEYEKHFYTLRVCKDCRADWLRSIQTWFENESANDFGNLEEGVAYIRDLGSNRPMTQEEIDSRN